MRKTFKIIIAIFAIIIIVVAFRAIIFLDIAAYTAAIKSQTLMPTGTSIGKAIVIYDPGLSGTAKGVAEKVAAYLQAKSYTVTVAGVKSSGATTTTAGYNIIVIGGPVYAGGLASSAKGAVESLVLKHDQGAKMVFSEADQGVTSPEDIAQIRHSIQNTLKLYKT